MNNKTTFDKSKQEALEILNKRKRLMLFAFVLLGAFIIFLTFGLVTLFGAIEGKLHYQAAAILLIISLNFLIGAIVLWIIRKTIFDRKLKEKETLIKKGIHQNN